MAYCDECGCYNDDHFDGTVTEEEFDNNELYEPNRYYYWHGDIQEDYQMPKGYECLCESCFGDLLGEEKIIEKYDDLTGKPNPNWNPETMGWFIPLDERLAGTR